MITQKQIEELRKSAKLAAEFSDPISNAARRMGFPYAATPQVILDLLARLDGLSEALESIACIEKPSQTNEHYWAGISHALCAETLATDTQIARLALEKFGVEKGKGDK